MSIHINRPLTPLGLNTDDYERQWLKRLIVKRPVQFIYKQVDLYHWVCKFREHIAIPNLPMSSISQSICYPESTAERTLSHQSNASLHPSAKVVSKLSQSRVFILWQSDIEGQLSINGNLYHIPSKER